MSVIVVIQPRRVMTWDQFRQEASPKSVALDGMVNSGPCWDEERLLANFDHHSGVIREATMSTAMQVLFAIKGGLMDRFGGSATVWINDPDQDTALATWLLKHHNLFDGVQSHPAINRLLALTDRLDITGGAFPMRLEDEVLEMHNWIFEPYLELRISGSLAIADAAVMHNCLNAVHGRLNAALMGQCGRRPIRQDATILYNSPNGFKVVDETGGNEARYALYSKGMNAFVSIVARRSDGRTVYSIGRRSRYIDFPLHRIYNALNYHEGTLYKDDRWGGSDIIGGSPRTAGSLMSWEEVRDVVENTLERRGDANESQLHRS